MEKRFAAWAFLLTLLLAACGNESETPKVPVEPASMFFEKSYHFCTELDKDRFLIGYYGNELLDTEVHFYIINPLGDTIHHQSWPSLQFGGESEDEINHAMKEFIDREPSAYIRGKHTGPGFLVKTQAEVDTIAFCRESHRVVQL